MSDHGRERGLLRAVRVMDRLRSPGGCPWDAEQDHRSLSPYLLEEAYEAVDAIEGGDRAHLREELGDVLLQVLFHARIAAEDPTEPFDIDAVAGELADKLERRHPHVFGDTVVDGAAAVDANWEQIKAAEKGRTGPYDGVTWSQPSLSLAAQVLRRADRAGESVELDAGGGEDDEAEIAAALLDVVRRAREIGVDPELALRRALREFADGRG